MNSHGRKLLRVAENLGVYLCTGRVIGDIPAKISYHGTSRSAATRLDHIIVSPNLLSHLQHSGIDFDRSDSDHFPLCTTLSFPTLLGHSPPLMHGGHLLPQIRWCPFAREPYARALQSDNLNLISKCEKATQDGDMQSSIRHFYALVQDAAENSGMYKLEKGRHAQKRQRLHQPFFDYECKTLKRDVWRYGMLANWRRPEFKK